VEHILPRQDNHTSDEVRWLCGVGGAALMLLGFTSRSWRRALLTSAGADLLTRSYSGHYLHEWLGIVGLTRKGLGALVPHQLGIKVDRSVMVRRPPEEVYRFFRNFQNLSRCLAHVNDIRETDDKHSHWFVKGPAGTELEWDAEIIQDQPNELISWRSVDSAQVQSAGSVRFERAAGERGTIVRVSLNYLPPAGALGAAVAKIMGEEPETQIKEDLRRMKQILEAGEIATTEGQPTGVHPHGQEERRESEPSGELAEEFTPVEPTKTKAATSGAAD